MKKLKHGNLRSHIFPEWFPHANPQKIYLIDTVVLGGERTPSFGLLVPKE